MENYGPSAVFGIDDGIVEMLQRTAQCKRMELVLGNLHDDCFGQHLLVMEELDHHQINIIKHLIRLRNTVSDIVELGEILTDAANSDTFMILFRESALIEILAFLMNINALNTYKISGCFLEESMESYIELIVLLQSLCYEVHLRNGSLLFCIDSRVMNM